MLKLRYTIPEFVEITGTPRSKVYDRIRRGELKVVKDGRPTYITVAEAQRYAETNQPLVDSPIQRGE